MRIYNIIKGFLILMGMIYFCLRLLKYILIDNPLTRLFFIKILIVIFIFWVIKKIIYMWKMKNLDIEYIRELPNKHSITINAYLYNKRLNVKSMIMAMILKFKDLDIISVEKVENKIVCKPKEHSNELKISISELYIYNWLIAQDKSRYSQKEFLEQVQKELDDSPLIKRTKKNLMIMFLIISMIPISERLGYISYDDYLHILIIFMLVFFCNCLYFGMFFKLKGDYTKAGKKEHYNLLAFYKFIKDFSLLSEREIEEYPLWKEYLQYAILFDINNNYKLKDDLNLLTDEEFKSFLIQLAKD